MKPFQSFPYYFNHASYFPVQDIVKKAMHYALEKHQKQRGSLFEFITIEKEHLIGQLRKHWNINHDFFCFGLSVSQFMSVFVYGYPFSNGDTVVVFQDDYPSLTLPWQLLSSKGVKVVLLNTDVVAEDIGVLEEAFRLHRPKFFACSAVHNLKGIRWPLKKIGELCKKYDVYFLLDGTQMMGVLDFNWDALAIDALLVSTYKWLMWPMGLGVMVLNSTLMDQLTPVTGGARSVGTDFSQSKPNLNWAEGAQRFEPGAINTLVLCAAQFMMNAFERLTQHYIEEKTLALSQQLKDGLIKKGYALYPFSNDRQHSQIVSVDVQIHSDLFQRLTKLGYVCIQREGVLRLSPAFYQSEKDIKNLLNCL